MMDVAEFALIGMAIVFFFCIGLPMLLAYRLAVRQMKLEAGEDHDSNSS